MSVIDLNYDKCLIGTIDFSEPLNEGSISGQKFHISGLEKPEVYIYGNEGGNIPHLHIVSEGFRDICIMLTDNRYFPHGKNTGILNSSQCKEFNKWMQDKNAKSGFSLTNWESCIFAWNLNSSIVLDIKDKAPNYNTIKPYK